MIDIEELERLAAQATPGPWKMVDARAFLDDEDYEIRNGQHCIGYGTAEDDAAYIVAACNAVPELIAENRELRERVRVLEEEGRTLGERLCETEHDLTDALDKKEELEGRIAELTKENSSQKRVIHILENKVLELKGQPIPMEPRLPTCDALCRPRYILQSNCSNAAKEAEK